MLMALVSAIHRTTTSLPRVGFAYQATQKLVVRGGFGMFYNGFENRGFSPNLGENYPFQFNFTYGSPNDVTPISAGTPFANGAPPQVVSLSASHLSSPGLLAIL